MSINRKDISIEDNNEEKSRIGEYLSDIQSWGKDNANAIIKNCAKVGAFATLLAVLIWNLSNGPLAQHVAASDVSNYVEALKVSGNYSEKVAEVDEALREASVAFSYLTGKEYEHGICTGTVLEEINAAGKDRAYTMIISKHCAVNKYGESVIQESDILWMGSSPNGARSEYASEGFLIKEYLPVENVDLAFIVFMSFSDTKTIFTPLGSNSLKSFNSVDQETLDGYSYPRITEGWPVPIKNLSTRGAEIQDDNSVMLPVSEFPFSLSASGAGLVNKETKIVALVRGFNYSPWNFKTPKKVWVEPITDNVISEYQKLLTRYRVSR